jgi:hypothetical protein
MGVMGKLIIINSMQVAICFSPCNKVQPFVWATGTISWAPHVRLVGPVEKYRDHDGDDGDDGTDGTNGCNDPEPYELEDIAYNRAVHYQLYPDQWMMLYGGYVDPECRETKMIVSVLTFHNRSWIDINNEIIQKIK